VFFAFFCLDVGTTESGDQAPFNVRGRKLDSVQDR
jgi:hypothetical protein